MKFESLTYNNFLGTKIPDTVIFEDSGITLITGKNGMGKTTKIEALVFGITGKTIRKISKTDIVNKDTKKNLEVEVVLYKGDKMYKICRYYKHKEKGNSVEIYENGELLSFKSVSDADKYIEQNIIDYEKLLKLIIFSQNNKKSFVNLTPKERFLLFTEILGLEKYEGYIDKLNERAKEIDDILNKTNIEKEKLEWKIQETEKSMKEEKEKTIKKKQEEENKLKELEKEKDELMEIIKAAGYETDEELDKEVENMRSVVAAKKERIENKKNIIENEKLKMDKEILELRTKLIENMQNEINKVEEKAKVEKGEINKLYFDEVKKLNSLLETITKQKESIKSVLDEEMEKVTKKLNEELAKIRKEKQDLQEFIINSKTKYNTYTAKIKEIEDELNNIMSANGGTCPFCKRALDKSVEEVFKADLEKYKEQAELYRKTLEANTKKDAELTKRMLEIEKEKDETTAFLRRESDVKIKALEQMYAAQTEKINSLREETQNKEKEIDKKYGDIKSDIKNKYKNLFEEEKAKIVQKTNKMLIVYEEEIKNLEKDLKEFEAPLNKLLELKNVFVKIRIKNDLISDVKERIKNIKFDEKPFKDKIEEIKKQIKDLEDKFKETNKEMGLIEFWKKSFSKNGLPLFLIGKFLPFLNVEINKILEEAGKDFNITITNIKELKSKSVKNEINIFAERNGYKLPLENLSGGQSKIVDIAIFLALNRLNETQNAIDSNILVFDEIFDALDNETIDIVVDMLKKISENKHLIIITHNEKFIEYGFDDIINVSA